jgi:Predicted transcriptional regulator, BolA superfamily
MLEQDIIDAIRTAIPDAQVEARMEGNHAHVTVVSAVFEGLSPVKKQQLVYGALNPAIASGAIHAVHMKTLVPGAH